MKERNLPDRMESPEHHPSKEVPPSAMVLSRPGGHQLRTTLPRFYSENQSRPIGERHTQETNTLPLGVGSCLPGARRASCRGSQTLSAPPSEASVEIHRQRAGECYGATAGSHLSHRLSPRLSQVGSFGHRLDDVRHYL